MKKYRVVSEDMVWQVEKVLFFSEEEFEKFVKSLYKNSEILLDKQSEEDTRFIDWKNHRGIFSAVISVIDDDDDPVVR